MGTSLIIILIICLAIPPITVAIFGKSWEVLLNVILTAFGILPGIAHAIFVIIDKKAQEKRAKELKQQA